MAVSMQELIEEFRYISAIRELERIVKMANNTQATDASIPVAYTITPATYPTGMKPGHEERRRDVIISLLNDGDYDQAARRLKYLIDDLAE